MAAAASLTSLFFLVFLFNIHARIIAASSADSHKTYIVYVSESEKPPLNTTHCDWYSSILHSLSPSSTDVDLYSSESLLCPASQLLTAPQHPNSSNMYYNLPTTKLLYSYEHAIHGFAARLSASQAAELRRRPGILFVIPDRISQLQTTRTPLFLGLDDSSGIWPLTNYGDDIIIGVLDTGIQPDHPSFSDAGLSPVPVRWTCEMAWDFLSCNNKVIGARAYYRGYEPKMQQSMEQLGESKSPADYNGHGTHVASIAAGSWVWNAGFYQYAAGEAKGVAIRARIAIYKVYWRGGYSDSDLLAAMDQAILDGVHVLSLSLGSNQATPYYEDPIAVGSFRAAARGILTSCAVGNSGSSDGTAINIAPWILTVGASTIDRQFRADVELGDGSILRGASLYSNNGSPPLPGHVYGPLVYAYDAGSRFCHPNELDPSVVRGKIVVCDVGGDIVGVAKGYVVHLAGGIGMILVNSEQQVEESKSKAHLIPATMVGFTDGNKIKNYIRLESSPTATITFRGTVVGRTPSAPRVWALSSRGPNTITVEILKPDVIAPGVDILAAWSKFASPSGWDDIDPRRVECYAMSGTSMACPHVSGIAALLHKARPDWSPAAIKSAIMTTASNVDNNRGGGVIVDLYTGRESMPFAHGSGHVDPNKALNPGLIYDIETSDYVQFLCAIGYTPDQLAVFFPGSVSCTPGITPGDLNYPYFSVVFSNGRRVVKQRRTVKNVGTVAAAVYTVRRQAPDFVQVTVSPDKLMFGKNKDTLTYEVTFTSSIGTIADTPPAFGWLEWSNGQSTVRSPIAVVWIPDSGVGSM